MRRFAVFALLATMLTPFSGSAPLHDHAAASTAALPPLSGSTVVLEAKDIVFDPKSITIWTRYLPVTIHMTNTGAALHNFTIDALGIDVDVSPGETVEVVIPAGTAPGAYDFYCNVPGHEEAGMVGTLIVNGPSASPTSQPDTSSTTERDEAGTPAGDASDCAGIEEFKDAYYRALFRATLENPDASEIIAAADDVGVDSEDLLDILSPAQILTLSGFHSDIASELALIEPPSYAAAWHQIQIETYQVIAEFLNVASTRGDDLAWSQFESEFDSLDQASEESLHDAGSCSDFINWAKDEPL